MCARPAFGARRTFFVILICAITSFALPSTLKFKMKVRQAADIVRRADHFSPRASPADGCAALNASSCPPNVSSARSPTLTRPPTRLRPSPRAVHAPRRRRCIRRRWPCWHAPPPHGEHVELRCASIVSRTPTTPSASVNPRQPAPSAPRPPTPRPQATPMAAAWPTR